MIIQKLKTMRVVAVLSILATVLITMFAWQSTLSLIPMISALIYFVGCLINFLYVKMVGGIIVTGLDIAYMVLIASWVGVVFNAISLLLSIAGLVVIIFASRMSE